MKLLVVTGSVRNGRVADKILDHVKKEIMNNQDISLEVADLSTLPMPFFDAPVTPSSEDFAPTDKNVQTFTKLVAQADAVILLTPEYNHSYTPVLKNAIDWVYHEWKDKPVAFVGYGWVGGARAIKHLRDVLASNISARAVEPEANLRFMKEISIGGGIIDAESVSTAIQAVLEGVEATVAEPVTA